LLHETGAADGTGSPLITTPVARQSRAMQAPCA